MVFYLVSRYLIKCVVCKTCPNIINKHDTEIKVAPDTKYTKKDSSAKNENLGRHIWFSGFFKIWSHQFAELFHCVQNNSVFKSDDFFILTKLPAEPKFLRVKS